MIPSEPKVIAVGRSSPSLSGQLVAPTKITTADYPPSLWTGYAVASADLSNQNSQSRRFRLIRVIRDIRG